LIPGLKFVLSISGCLILLDVVVAHVTYRLTEMHKKITAEYETVVLFQIIASCQPSVSRH
jgi:hypothetical protein